MKRTPPDRITFRADAALAARIERARRRMEEGGAWRVTTTDVIHSLLNRSLALDERQAARKDG